MPETPNHLTVDTSPRGFDSLPAIPSMCGGRVAAYESSVATEAVIQLGVTDSNGPEGPIEAVVQLTAESAWKLAEQLMSLVQNHYQGDARPEVRAYDQVVTPVQPGKLKVYGWDLPVHITPKVCGWNLPVHIIVTHRGGVLDLLCSHGHETVSRSIEAPESLDWRIGEFLGAHKHAGAQPACTCGYSNDDDPRTDHHPRCEISRL